MRYVVDASVLIEYLIAGADTARVQSFFDSVSDDDVLLVPEFCLLECCNVLWKQCRFSGMRQTDAFSLIEILIQMPLSIVPMSTILRVALETALEYTLPVYDSCYIALAQRAGVPLVTLDRLQSRAAQSAGVSLLLGR